MLVLALTLGGFSVLLYHTFSQSLYENEDDLISLRAEGVASAIDTYWETEKLDAIKEGVNTEVFSKINNINFVKIAQRWVKEKSNDPELIGIVVHILDSKGTQIASSKNSSTIMNSPKEILHSLLEGNSRFDTFNIKLSETRPQPARVFTLPVIENNKVAYIVQVTSPLSPIYATLNGLRTILFILLPLTVFITGIMGVFLAKLTLHPVDSMIKTIHQITAENLKLRINIPATKDEIKKLADTFNEMLQRLDAAFSSQKEFIQDISHELRTPLTILKGELEVTLNKIRSPKEYESVLLSSLEEIDRISRVVENLLLLARFDTKEMPLKLTPADLNRAIEEAISGMKTLAGQKNIRMEFRAEEKIVLAMNQNQMRQLLLNLLDNAVKYTPEKGRISATLSRENNHALIKISDTGIGMREDELPRIFDRFYRADKSRSAFGFGLGLSIVKSIVETHKGTIRVESKIGQGTTFTVSLPLSTSP